MTKSCEENATKKKRKGRIIEYFWMFGNHWKPVGNKLMVFLINFYCFDWLVKG